MLCEELLKILTKASERGRLLRVSGEEVIACLECRLWCCMRTPAPVLRFYTPCCRLELKRGLGYDQLHLEDLYRAFFHTRLTQNFPSFNPRSIACSYTS